MTYHSALGYRPEIDGLRALAVLAVIAFHFKPSLVPGGFLGVDIFFVISGFLIGAIAIRASSDGNFSIAQFLERRLRRLLPALFFVCLLCFIPAWFYLPPSDFGDFTESILANVLGVANYLFMSEAGYFDRASEMKPLLHTWSLSLEIQFYLAFAVLVAIARKTGLINLKDKNVQTIVFLCITFGFILFVLLYENNPNISFYIFPARIWEFAIGILVALKLSKGTKPIAGLAAASLLVIFLVIFGIAQSTYYKPLATLLVVTATALLIGNTLSGGLAARVLSVRVLSGIGLISYSLYLVHNPVLVFARFIDIENSELFLLIALPLMFLFAYLSWRFVENPFRNRQLVSLRACKLTAAAFSLLAITVFSLNKETNGFLLQRLDAQQQAMMNTAVKDERDVWCQTGGANFRPPSDACLLYGDTPSWAVFGDSHAGALAYALADSIVENRGQATQWLSMRGCAPTWSDSSSPCARWTRESLDYLAKSKHIKHIVVVYRLNAYFYGSMVNAHAGHEQYHSEEKRRVSWQNYAGIIEALKATGKEIIIVSPIPEPLFHVNDLVFKRGESNRTLVSIPRAKWDSRNKFAMGHLSRLEGVRLFRSDETFCDRGNCFQVLDLNALYYDHNHLSFIGAKRLASAFSDIFLQ
ncbi:Peptidoglycan/LPS O-acetylase OafA/YrhL, contains acyltransferase and SGNH-hydrolase domains [Alteromonadaceae bacterium Bs31]|nr:Peptidoglycan/LPS O-acetylase OafA/YrhL, contains acyltransferase and SGNH-hydrolase domains [Alteromonadaceae bacterium Bs31]